MVIGGGGGISWNQDGACRVRDNPLTNVSPGACCKYKCTNIHTYTPMRAHTHTFTHTRRMPLVASKSESGVTARLRPSKTPPPCAALSTWRCNSEYRCVCVYTCVYVYVCAVKC